jgi:hypothetical protein
MPVNGREDIIRYDILLFGEALLILFYCDIRESLKCHMTILKRWVIWYIDMLAVGYALLLQWSGVLGMVLQLSLCASHFRYGFLLYERG